VSVAADEFPCVLVVDDEPAIRGLLQVMLRRLGYTPLLAPGCAEAVQTFRGRTGPVALALVDVRMPGGDGPATLAALRALDPGLPCCFMTGHSGAYSEEELLGRGALGVLYKPFPEHALAGVLRRSQAGGPVPA
jgi:DNA-binding NtrC family response regulator